MRENLRKMSEFLFSYLLTDLISLQADSYLMTNQMI